MFDLAIDSFEITALTRDAIFDWIKSFNPIPIYFQAMSTTRTIFGLGNTQGSSMRGPQKLVWTLLPTVRKMRRTKATLIYRRTRNLDAVQLLLGHPKLESAVR